MSQQQRVLKRLKQGPLTQYQAFQELGVQRLGARIYDLKWRGYNIIAEPVEVKNRFGDNCRVAKYRLIEGKSNE